MLIDSTYFISGTRRIRSSTLGKSTLGKQHNAEENSALKAIEPFISEYQEEYLTSMLGDSLGNKVHTYMICLDEDEAPVHNDKFDSLCAQLKESFADYVFFHFLRYTSNQVTLNGVVRIKNENTQVAPIMRQVHVWNSMVKRHANFVKWCNTDECPVTIGSINKDMLTRINQFNL